ncbi:DUF6779 domain-containing protein [Blastococcus sp. TF02A-30]|uniref:DUF6779 domain-containing protein n=1 Tax=Blastococcus sp. TF02A-30 TaxID=2250580 RepID=UPI000DEB36D1|nr:DUF6779 domain-containing protein [Blastococcus sp. TF02A-30]RBY83460.1 hypothetical protein DQ241_19465 [Blastococcus sp. TF02A-30]
MPRRPDDAAARGAAGPNPRTLALAGGFVLALGATAAVFLTDNPRYLRVAVVAVAWAFVLATVAAGRLRGDRAAAAARETELRLAYEYELDREVAARREYELEVENEVRRDTEDAMRVELDALRGELAQLSGLREEVSRVAALGTDLAGLAALREEVARVAALRDDVAALTSLRQELGQLAELRADMGRLRAELTEQLSSEMLVERIVMRTQASRLPGEPPRLDGPPTRTLESWTEQAPRELTGGWPAIRLDEPRETQQFEQVRVERSVPAPQPTYRPEPTYRAEPVAPAGPATTAFPLGPSSPAPRVPVAPPPPAAPAEPTPSPVDWLAARSLLDVPPPAHDRSPGPPPVPPRPSPRRRRGDDPLPPASVAEAPTAETRAPSTDRVRIEDRGGYRVRTPAPEPAPEPARGPDTADRLAEILAENGVTPAGGGRRRRRYREDGDSDDVLSRVLGRS